jgi:hypothetical protein
MLIDSTSWDMADFLMGAVILVALVAVTSLFIHRILRD